MGKNLTLTSALFAIILAISMDTNGVLAQSEMGAPCTYAASITIQSFGGSGGSGSATVSSPPNCSWSAESNADWILVSGGGAGDGGITYVVAPNGTARPRSGSITVAGQRFTITEVGCWYSINPRDQSFEVAGGSGSVTVSTADGCAWTGTSNDSWITLDSGGGNGDGTLSYVVAANDQATQRWGSITVAGRHVTITQDGTGLLLMAGLSFPAMQDGAQCISSISPSSASFIADGGSDSISVTAPEDCHWTVTGDSRWIRVTSGGSGSGDGTFTYAVSASSDNAVRMGSLTIDGLPVIVVQAGLP
jgi:Viral BACON domain/Putative binding domain, N-terminal